MKFSRGNVGARAVGCVEATLFRRTLALTFHSRHAGHKVAEQLYWIGAKRPDNCHKFDHVDTPFAALVFGDKGLWSAELPGQRLLPDIGILPRCDKSSQ